MVSKSVQTLSRRKGIGANQVEVVLRPLLIGGLEGRMLLSSGVEWGGTEALFCVIISTFLFLCLYHLHITPRRTYG